MLKLFAILFTTAAVAQTPLWYPLATGNHWVYRVSARGSNDAAVVQVAEERSFSGRGYATLRGLPGGDLYVRNDASGNPLLYNQAGARELAWVDSNPDACSRSGKANFPAKYSGPMGTFDNAVEYRYQPTCADAGVEHEVFLPYIGLVQRVETTIAGPRAWDLIYAQINGAIYAAQASTDFTLSLGGVENGAVLARLTLRHTLPEPLALRFNSGQSFDIDVVNAKGERVFRWSDGRAFTQVVRDVMVSSEATWAAAIPVKGLAPGDYTVEARLTANRAFRALATLRIR